MTQDALARMSSVSRPSITAMERGKSNPRFATLDQVARVLDVDILELITSGLPASASADNRPSLERIARNVNKVRAALGVSQETLSVQSRHFRTYVGNLERQVVNPSLSDVEAIAFALGVGIETLLQPLEPGELEVDMQRLVRKTRKET
ncbi:hypothetical protein AYM40_35355 [Paraburkholderia phytofirmans OLGA172]|uniref:HTH cro/C1-type domain-containing protein n=2 Tax=Paraburkholderia phytofirmans TaxID=261302 RepID=A0A160FVJ3_9BURK|nr:hypothetical protein AYM40_35355 [Paraburkholderia phytofirmans OLGA172]